jgi:NADH-quinone oxidoreductase subunit C
MLNLKVELEKDRPEMPSLTPMMAGANYIEREIRELFGIEFLGHPEPKRLILPDGWQEGKHPLRSNYKEVRSSHG